MASQGPFRTQPLKSLDDVSPDDLKSLLVGIAEAHPDLAGEVNARMDRMREMTTERAKAVSETDLTKEQAERLAFYKTQYEKMDSGSKAGCTWKEFESRLLKNNGYYLGMAEGLNQKGVLFGVDKEGNPLFADEGDKPIMTGMNYPDTRNRVMYKYEGDNMVKKKGKPVSTSYELFPYEGKYEKSDEIKMYEQNTGRPIVASSDREECCSIWLESGKNLFWARFAVFNPGTGNAAVGRDNQRNYPSSRGVRRLLRVKKS